MLVGIICFSYFLGLVFAPFPCWPTVFKLWRTLLFDRADATSKIRQFTFLILVIVRAPFWTFFWYVDELLFPEYRNQLIDPVFIIGQPRCGTTLLHRTLAQDNQTFFAVRHIEWRYPFISVQKVINLLGLNKWLEKVDYWPKSQAGQMASKMHKNRLSDWEEDGIFFEENFLHHFFIYLRFPYPDLLPHLDAYATLRLEDQQRMLEMHHKVLKKVSFLRGAQGRFYLSKEVTSHNKLPALAARYPSARFIVVTRESGKFMSSLMPLVRMSTWSKTGIDPLTLPNWEDSMLTRMRSDSLNLVELCEKVIPLERQTRVSASDVMVNVVDSISIIYRELGLVASREFVNYLTELEVNQEDRERGYEYLSLSPKGFEQYDNFTKTNAQQFRKKIDEIKSQRL